MKVSITTVPLQELDVDLLVIPVFEDGASEYLNTLGAELDEVVRLAASDLKGSLDEAVMVYPTRAKAKRIGLVGAGRGELLDAEQLRRVTAAGEALARRAKAETVGIVQPSTDLDPEVVGQAIVEGFMLSSYRFTRYKTGGDVYAGADRIVVHVGDQEKASRRGVERGRIMAEAVMTARDLVNTSPHEKTATAFSRQIEKLGKKHGFSTSIWDKALIEDEGMGGLLAVNRGSQEPPTFTILEWKPENAGNEWPIVLVGKGVMFDTGGLSLKPTKDSMDSMKSDMSGAAAVVGAMEAVARLELPLYIVGLIPATDNRPGEKAYVPGDVVRMHSGKTVEVLNTDAEGRMILADALSYARTYKPALVLELATLTGAQVVALGSEVAAVMTNDRAGADDRLNAIEAAGRRSGDLVHRMPMYEHYGKLIESDVADIKNVGGREAGSITAAKFLEHFTDYPWLHVDLAGPSFIREAKPYRPKGGTGFGVRLLIEFLRDYSDPRKRQP
jgi:leucyl aminopeptidase